MHALDINPIVTRTDAAEELYMPGEVAPQVLRAELDANRQELDRLRAQLAEQRSDLQLSISSVDNKLEARITLLDGEVKQRHDNYGRAMNDLSSRITELEKLKISLTGLTGNEEDIGRVGRLEASVKKQWTKLTDLKAKYWRLALILVGTGAAGVGGGVGLSQILGLS